MQQFLLKFQCWVRIIFQKINWRSSAVFWYVLFKEQLCVHKNQHKDHYVSEQVTDSHV